MDEKQRDKLVGLAQTLAMTALEHPPDQRQVLIKGAIEKLLNDFEQKHGPNPVNAELAKKLLSMTTALLKILEESGGTVGHA